MLQHCTIDRFIIYISIIVTFSLVHLSLACWPGLSSLYTNDILYQVIICICVICIYIWYIPKNRLYINSWSYGQKNNLCVEAGEYVQIPLTRYVIDVLVVHWHMEALHLFRRTRTIIYLWNVIASAMDIFVVNI